MSLEPSIATSWRSIKVCFKVKAWKLNDYSTFTLYLSEEKKTQTFKKDWALLVSHDTLCSSGAPLSKMTAHFLLMIMIVYFQINSCLRLNLEETRFPFCIKFYILYILCVYI